MRQVRTGVTEAAQALIAMMNRWGRIDRQGPGERERERERERTNPAHDRCFQMEKIKDRSQINFILNYSFSRFISCLIKSKE